MILALQSISSRSGIDLTEEAAATITEQDAMRKSFRAGDKVRIAIPIEGDLNGVGGLQLLFTLQNDPRNDPAADINPRQFYGVEGFRIGRSLNSDFPRDDDGGIVFEGQIPIYVYGGIYKLSGLRYLVDLPNGTMITPEFTAENLGLDIELDVANDEAPPFPTFELPTVGEPEFEE